MKGLPSSTLEMCANSRAGYCTVKLAAVVLAPPAVVTVMGPLVAPPGTVAHT